MSEQENSAQIIDTSQIKSYSVILYDTERITKASISNIRVPRAERGVRVIPVRGSVENALQVLTDEEMNRAGWFRKEEEDAQPKA